MRPPKTSSRVLVRSGARRKNSTRSLATARTEFDDATEKSRQTETALAIQVDALAELDRTLGQTTESHRESNGSIEGSIWSRLLADRLDDVTALLAKRLTLKRDCATAVSGRAEARKTVARLDGEIAELSEKLAVDRGRKEASPAISPRGEASLAAIDERRSMNAKQIFSAVLGGCCAKQAQPVNSIFAHRRIWRAGSRSSPLRCRR